MEKSLVIGLSLLYLLRAQSTNISVTNKPMIGFLNSGLKDYNFIVALGTDDTREIFCLGSVISHFSVLTLASCFDGFDYVLAPLAPTESGFQATKRLKKRRVERQNRLNTTRSPEIMVYEYGKFTATDSTIDFKEAEDDNDEDDDDDDEYEDEIITYWLYRISAELQAFVRLAVDGKMVASHSDYKPPVYDTGKLWRNDVAILFTSASIDFSKVHPVSLTTLVFGDYIKSLHEEMVNTMNCQVIGLIEYDDDARYSPLDTEVQLAAHDVLVVYDKCDSKFCLEDPGYCASTGHHISKDPRNPLPYFLRGSPLVCQGKLLSVVNIHSHCNYRRYSAEFPAPEVIRQVLEAFHFLREEENREFHQNHSVSKIPLPKWRTVSGCSGLRCSLFFVIVFVLGMWGIFRSAHHSLLSVN